MPHSTKMSEYFRPLVRRDFPRPTQALSIAGGPGWCTHAQVLRRDGSSDLIDVDAIPDALRQALSAPRAPLLGMQLDQPRIMGILNVTPDSFSDGGRNTGATQATTRGMQMVADGVDIIDVGGESTRPGAPMVPAEAEIARIEPVIIALRHTLDAPISIDTRKIGVADAAVRAGAAMVNDVSGFTYDRLLAPYCARMDLPVCVMHARGDPQTMQIDPHYDNVLLDVYDFLAAQIAMLTQTGIQRSRIIVDPGIGFGKTQAHNLAILNGISLFHGLGCPILLGASRKGFIGRISSVPEARKRVAGSVAVALSAVAQGVQILRVHDVAETRQALTLWSAVEQGEHYGS